MNRQPTFLMTDPSLYDVAYQINPWMKPGDWSADPVANRQAAKAAPKPCASLWKTAAPDVTMIPAEPGVPDLVFPANAAVVAGWQGSPGAVPPSGAVGRGTALRAARSSG